MASYRVRAQLQLQRSHLSPVHLNCGSKSAGIQLKQRSESHTSLPLARKWERNEKIGGDHRASEREQEERGQPSRTLYLMVHGCLYFHLSEF